MMHVFWIRMLTIDDVRKQIFDVRLCFLGVSLVTDASIVVSGH